MNNKQKVAIALLLLCAIAIWDVYTHGVVVFSSLLDQMVPKTHYGDGEMDTNVPQIRSHESVNLDVTDLKKLTIVNPYGRVLITGEKSNVIKGDLSMIVYASSERVSKEYLQKLKLTWKKTGSSIELAVRPDWQSPTGIKAVRVDYLLTVPEGMELDLVGNDHVKVEQITGKVKVKNLLGVTEVMNVHNDVQVIQHGRYAQLTNINGNIRVNSEEGGINVGTVQGQVQIESHQGIVDLTKVKGDVEIKSTSTPTTVKEVEGRCTVNSFEEGVTLGQITGPIIVQSIHSYVQINEPKDDVDITVEDGEVDVTSPLNHTVIGRVFNGIAKTSRPELKLAKDVQNQLITGTIGEGKYQLKVEVKLRGRISID